MKLSQRNRHNRSFVLAAVLLAASPVLKSASGQVYMDVTSLAPGAVGSWDGTLGGSSVHGEVTTPAPLSFSLRAVGSTFSDSTINDTSPQFNDGSIYTPSTPAADRIGYNKLSSTANAQITVTFSPPITNPVFHIANLDSSVMDFSATPGLLSTMLLSGNGGAGDGLALTSNTLYDLNPNTVVAWPVNSPPPTVSDGARSSYGSMELLGTFSTILIDSRTSTAGDGGSFTFSITPEPSALGVFAAGTIATLCRRRRPAT